jgi:putative salt-induced outer membrane protein YdiY
MRWVLVLTVLLIATEARAQIVNVQGQLAKAPEKDSVIGQVEAKLDWREGNSPLFQVGGAAALLIHEGRFIGLVLVKGEWGESRGIALSRKTFEHVRGRYRLDERRFLWEAFAQHEFDKFRRLSVRAIVGTGPVWQIVHEKEFGLLAGAAYLFELEQLDERPMTTDAGDRTIAHRASFYLTGVEKIGEQVAIVQTIYAQPRLGDPGDLRMLGEISVTTKLSKHVALTDSFTVAYDRTPPDGIKRFDTQLTFGLLVTF